ncbi:peptidase M24, structural domain-containing protein [Dimargaris cristalligena]|uniref:Peptidase M24, structural domain-containing protein n=1 Tax=Dimargaris cristalligena TaxID=215637 RepID=A0A4P9ZQE3_9FUNG|nr:peptidase M24, structural domain-containing protein [Dimargaris cristalligena]|eukprot:RKP35567.1 peptidase M24, structural domain-containing protein [Dimargaris cristalligena]
MGQPIPASHPHLIAPGEVTPGISYTEYEARRRQLLDRLPDNSLALVFGHRLHFKATHVFYPFHQNSDFLYLTGFNEPDAIFMLEKSSALPQGHQLSLFVLPQDPHSEKWEGPRAGLEGVKQHFGSYQAYNYKDFSSHLYKVCRQLETASASGTSCPVYADLPTELVVDSPPHQAQTMFGELGITLHKLSPMIQNLRLYKSAAEVKLMQKAGDISALAFRRVMAESCRCPTEHHITALFDYECQWNGGEEMAYVPVVAGGANALSLHYVQNNQLLSSGDLILLDGGTSYRHYASDVTRTWPVGGTFSQPQAELYSAVLRVQKACMALCTEDAGLSLNQIHWRSVALLKEELWSLGWQATQEEIDNVLYPHHIGHYLGIDVHDTLDISRSLKLKDGMVITIEPGIYVPYDDRFPEQYQGIGIRIEDNLVIGKSEAIILSRSVPKEIDEIETACHAEQKKQ